MGFYGNIVNSNKASFTFDRIYSSRRAMDAAMSVNEGDGVFLGRYVLIDYDEPPIKGYYFANDKKFYHDVHHTRMIAGKEGCIYQDLHTGSVNNFYLYENGAWKLNNTGTPYAASYTADVTDYGRGYDGTAWVKQYEANADGGRYKYVLVAELNTVIPNFHLLVEPPAENANAPYFDRDSTNVDYYLHVTPTLKNEIGIVGQNDLSDEKINQYEDIWNYPTGNQHKEEHAAQLQTNQPGNIYYNAAGFDVAKRTFNTTIQDSINYELTESGRHYSNGAYDPYGKTGVADTRTWHIHLPSIGNAICSVWDKMYGTSRNQTYSSSRGDSKALYDQTTFIGAVNRLRDLLGYTFKAKGSLAVGHAIAVEDNNLYYDGNPPSAYYYYAYSPEFKADSTGDYYKDGNEFKPVNKQVITSGYYRLVDRWVLTQLRMPEEDSLYGFIIALHRLVGTGDDDSRDVETIRGCINKIKDIVANIDLQLKPGKLMHTNNSGVIETTDTAYPSADVDKTRVLIGQPTGGHSWENRIRKIGIITPSTSETTWTTSTGEIDSNTNNNNTVNFKAGNKWIGLNVNTANQLVEIVHSKSAQAAHEFAPDMQIQNLENETKSECSYTFPLVNTDNAGHVIGSTNTTIYVPYVYKNIALNAQSTAIANAPSDNTNTQSAASTNDTFTFATSNKWIRAEIKDKMLSYGHLVQTINTSTPTSDLNTSGTFNTEEYTYDEAGHIRSKAVRTLTLPYNYKTIKVAQSSGVTAITPNTNSIVAANQVDTYTLGAGNKWIQLAATNNDTGDTITLAHSLQGTAGEYTGTDKTFTGFGDSVTLYGYTTDNAGHITANPTYTLTLPKGSLTDTASTTASDVLTSINFVDTTGALTTTHQQIGTMLLTGYDYNAENTNKITNADTIHTAFSKLDAQIAKEVTDRSTAVDSAVYALSTSLSNAVTTLHNEITSMDERLVASDESLSASLNQEKLERAQQDTAMLTAAKEYTDKFVAETVDSSPETLNTLRELATALGDDPNFATTVATNIGLNTTAINVEKARITAHLEDQNNPHKVSAIQVGLGNVTNESKTTMFTNPAFTGVPTAPTANADINNTQIATTAFVHTVANSVQETANANLEAEKTARDLREVALQQSITSTAAQETLARTIAIQEAVQEVFDDLLANYGLILNKPTFTVEQTGEQSQILTVLIDETMQDECTCIWYKKQVDADAIPVSEAVQMTAEETGEYYCIVTRTHNTHISSAESNVYSIVIQEPEEPTPDPEEPTI